MYGWLATWWLVAQIAARNLFASRLKTLIIGGFMGVGSLAVLVGGALMDSVEQGIASSIQGSIAGNIQVYSAQSRDPLVIWGRLGGEPDMQVIPDFAAVRKSLEALESVKAVVPMGMERARISTGNTIDRTLEELRQAVGQQKRGDDSDPLRRQIESLKAHIRHMASILAQDVSQLATFADSGSMKDAGREALARADSDAFWLEFDQDPYKVLEFLENRVAPLASDSERIFIRYVGTDIPRFAQTFDRMQIVDGESVPEGARGILISKYIYEDQLKLKNARRLDRLMEARESGRSIAADPELQAMVEQNKSQLREILLQLDPLRAKTVVARLQAALKTQETELSPLLLRLFEIDDSTLEAHYRIFYDQVAPLLSLYRVRVGDTLTVRAITSGGYVNSVNVRVYGTFRFAGLEKSALAGSFNILDLASFRSLYGYRTSAQSEEIARLQEEVGEHEISRESAEDALFGGSASSVEVEAMPENIDDTSLFGTARVESNHEQIQVDTSDAGIVLSAAVILENPERLDEAMEEIRQVSERDGLDLAVMSWQEAAGIVGQFAVLLELVLYVSVLIIFVVALLIISNATMMATLERVREIGTLRAIGAQRRFVWQMVLVESAVVGLLFGAIGVGLGALIVFVLGAVGIPATTDAMYFLFCGPRLFPSFGAVQVIAALCVSIVIGALSSLYPAWMASRISPLQAMQTGD